MRNVNSHFKFLALLALLFIMSLQVVQAVSIAQEVKSCHVAWDKYANEEYEKAFNLSNKNKCPRTHTYLLWEKLRNENGSFEEYQDFIEKHPHWPWMSILFAKAEMAMDESLSPKKIIKWATSYQPRTLKGAVLYLNALQKTGKARLLSQKVKHFWHIFDLTADQQQEFLSLYKSLLTTEDHKRRMDKLLLEQKKTEAKMLLPYLDKNDQPLAQARIFILEGQENPNIRPTDHLDLIYEQVRLYRKKDDLKGAHLLIKLNPNNTNSLLWGKERLYFAREAFNQGQPELGYRVMLSHPSRKHRNLIEGEWFCGWLGLRYLNRSKEALKHFSAYQKQAWYPKAIAKAAYWMGRTYESLGDKKAAKSEYKKALKYPTTYYSLLSQKKLNKNIQVRYEKEKSIIDQKAWGAFQNQEFAVLSRLLHATRQEDKALPFLYLLGKRAKTRAEKRMVLKLIQQVLNSYTVLAMQEIGYVEHRILPWTHPFHKINKRALQQGVDPNMMLAVMRQESGFHPKAISPAGAAGLMQVMPGTAEKIAQENNYKHKKACLTEDSHYNVLLGSHYFRKVLDQFDRSYVLAIASYNAGPKPVKKWIERYGHPSATGVDIVDWIESIPYSETRDYVKSVLANYYIYTALS